MARVYKSSVIPASAKDVWARIRDFNGLPTWHTRMKTSHIENDEPSDKIGCIRNFQLQSGPTIREQLVSLSDQDMSFSYTMLEGPQPVSNYLATVRLTSITDGDQTFAEWSAEFDCDPDKEAALTEGTGTNVFQGGFDALKKHFNG